MEINKDLEEIKIIASAIGGTCKEERVYKSMSSDSVEEFEQEFINFYEQFCYSLGGYVFDVDIVVIKTYNHNVEVIKDTLYFEIPYKAFEIIEYLESKLKNYK